MNFCQLSVNIFSNSWTLDTFLLNLGKVDSCFLTLDRFDKFIHTTLMFAQGFYLVQIIFEQLFWCSYSNKILFCRLAPQHMELWRYRCDEGFYGNPYIVCTAEGQWRVYPEGPKGSGESTQCSRQSWRRLDCPILRASVYLWNIFLKCISGIQRNLAFSFLTRGNLRVLILDALTNSNNVLTKCRTFFNF